MGIDLPVFPDPKLPDPSRPWGREVQQRVVQLQKDVALIQQNTGLGSKKTDSSQNRVGEQVQSLQDTVDYLSSFETFTAFDDVMGSGSWTDDVFHKLGDLTPEISFTLVDSRQVSITLGSAASIAGTAQVGNQIEVILRCYVLLYNDDDPDAPVVTLPISGIVSARQTVPDMTVVGTTPIPTHNAGTSGNLTCENSIALDAGNYTVRGYFRASGASTQVSSGLYVSDRSLSVSITNRV